MTSALQLADSVAQRDPTDAFSDASMTILVRRALLQCTHAAAPLADLIDCADLLETVSLADAAETMRAAIGICCGFSARRMPSLTPENGHLRPLAIASGVDGGSVALAISELRTLLSVPIDPEPPLGRPVASVIAQPTSGSTDTRPVRAIDLAEVAILLKRTHEALHLGSPDTVRDVLADIHVAFVHRAAFGASEWSGATITELSVMVAANQVRRFFLDNYDLSWGPYGSAQLLVAASRLSETGLGPYLRHVSQLIRHPREVIGLARLACGSARGETDDLLQQSCILLSAHLRSTDRVRLADELGDRGMIAALAGLLGSERLSPQPDHALLAIIRDAALDNGEIQLAIEAQRVILDNRLRNVTEWIVLGELVGTAGAMTEAESAFSRALILSPGDARALERLTAIEKGSFAEFHVTRGFGTPMLRSLARQNRRFRQTTSTSKDQASTDL